MARTTKVTIDSSKGDGKGNVELSVTVHKSDGTSTKETIGASGNIGAQKSKVGSFYETDNIVDNRPVTPAPSPIKEEDDGPQKDKH